MLKEFDAFYTDGKTRLKQLEEMLKKNAVKRAKEEIFKALDKKIEFMSNEIREELKEESKKNRSMRKI